MSTEISEKVIAQIIKRLTASHNPNDIILDICSQTELNWGQAEELVQRIQAENRSKIVLRQSPLLILLALGLFLTGTATVVYAGYRVYVIYSASASPESFFLYLAVSGQALVASLLVGAAMIAGSLIGMQSIWEAFFEWLKE